MKSSGSGTEGKASADNETQRSTKEGKQASSDQKSETKRSTKHAQSSDTNAKTKEPSSQQMKSENSGSKESRKSASDENHVGGKTTSTMSKSDESGNAGTSGEKTGSVQKNGGVDVKVSAEQRTEIKQVITENHVQPVEHVNFEINVGTSIPHTVHLHQLPPRIVKLVPGYEGYEYFVLADGRIIIVDPDSYEIVYVLA